MADHDSEALREAITDIAKGYGFFAVWYHVFRSDTDMRRRMIEAFPGTARDAFDANCKLIRRPTDTL